MLIKIIIYGIFMMVSGYCIFKIESLLRKASVINSIEENLNYDEKIICENAIVTCNSDGEIAWYDADKEFFKDIDKKPEKNTKDTRKK